MKKIVLKKYTSNYYDFVYKIKKQVYKRYVEECWGKWNEEAQKEYYEKFINTYGNQLYIIVVDNQDVGFYNGEIIDDDTYELGNICITREYQGKGIGSQVLNIILEEYKNKNIKLQCFKQNPVKKLYERLGFTISGETTFHYQMIKEK